MQLPLVEAVSPVLEKPHNNESGRSLFFWLVWLVSIALLVWFLIDGFSYYTTPYADRPHDLGYREFRPAGTRGLMYGYAGAGMLVLMLIYSVRKRTKLLGRKISLRSLLDFHIYLGVMGPLFIVLHTAFKVQGLVAVAFWSMVAVAASGFFGRYLYLQIPRNIQGTELTIQELNGLMGDLTKQLRNRFELDDAGIIKLEGVTARYVTGFGGGAMRAIGLLLVDDLFRPFVRRRFVHEIMVAMPMPKRQLREFAKPAFTRALLQRRVALLAQVQQTFHYWHVIHKPFAILMYIIMMVHISVVVWTGYGWVW